MGYNCAVKCAYAGMSCTSHWKHPFIPDVGYGALFRCALVKIPQYKCAYAYPNGEICDIFHNPERAPLCK